MVTQKHKENCWLKFSAFLNAYLSKTQLNFFDSFRPYGRLLENQKTRGSREIFLPENDFQASSAVNFPKKTSRF